MKNHMRQHFPNPEVTPLPHQLPGGGGGSVPPLFAALPVPEALGCKNQGCVERFLIVVRRSMAGPCGGIPNHHPVCRVLGGQWLGWSWHDHDVKDIAIVNTKRVWLPILPLASRALGRSAGAWNYWPRMELFDLFFEIAHDLQQIRPC